MGLLKIIVALTVVSALAACGGSDASKIGLTKPVDPVVDPTKPVDPVVDPTKPVNPVVDPTKPVDPVVDPTKPVNPVVDPTKPVDPVVDPTKPVNPVVDPTKPVDPVVDPTKPVNPVVDPTKPVNPVVDPTKPVNPVVDPTKPVDPVVDPTKPVDPVVDPTKPVDPVVDPTKPVNPVVDPTKPVDPVVDPTKPVNPVVDPTKPVDPVVDPTKPVNPVVDPTKPVDPVVDPTKPVDPVVDPTKPVNPVVDPTKPVKPDTSVKVIDFVKGKNYQVEFDAGKIKTVKKDGLDFAVVDQKLIANGAAFIITDLKESDHTDSQDVYQKKQVFLPGQGATEVKIVDWADGEYSQIDAAATEQYNKTFTVKLQKVGSTIKLTTSFGGEKELTVDGDGNLTGTADYAGMTGKLAVYAKDGKEVVFVYTYNTVGPTESNFVASDKKDIVKPVATDIENAFSNLENANGNFTQQQLDDAEAQYLSSGDPSYETRLTELQKFIVSAAIDKVGNETSFSYPDFGAYLDAKIILETYKARHGKDSAFSNEQHNRLRGEDNRKKLLFTEQQLNEYLPKLKQDIQTLLNDKSKFFAAEKPFAESFKQYLIAEAGKDTAKMDDMKIEMQKIALENNNGENIYAAAKGQVEARAKVIALYNVVKDTPLVDDNYIKYGLKLEDMFRDISSERMTVNGVIAGRYQHSTMYIAEVRDLTAIVAEAIKKPKLDW